MSSGQLAIPSIRSSKQSRRTPKARKMKISLKQRIRNWLMEDDDEIYSQAIMEVPSLDSEGMRFTVFKASGGFVIETRTYDRRKDESNNKIYVITEHQDLGAELGKIITMESLR